MKRKIIVLAALCAVLFLAGCGIPYHKKLDTMLSAGDYEAAAGLIEAEKENGNSYRDNSILLYYMDAGSVAQMRGLYDESTEKLIKADDIIADLYTKSVTKELSSFLQNDTNLDYAGEDFEQVMVTTMRALNFMYKNDMKAAAVEARRINHKLSVISDAYGEKAVYTDDAFARYLSAIAHETGGDLNSALIDYRRSVSAYRKYAAVYGTAMPEQPVADLFRMANAMNFTDEVNKLKAEWGDIRYTAYRELRSKGEVILVFYDGLPAYKVDKNKWPSYVQRGKNILSVKLASSDGAESSGFIAQDLSAIAVKNLEARLGLIFAKKLASGIVKEFARQVPVLGLFVTADKADTRSWRALPSRFHVSRIAVKPGKNRVNALVETRGAKGPEVQEIEFEVNLKQGEKKVIPVYMLK